MFVYPDTTLQGGQVLAFKPYRLGELCNGRTMSYYGELTDVVSGEVAVGTVRLLRYDGSNTIYLSGRGASGSADSIPVLSLLAWQGSSPRSWELGDFSHGFGVIVETDISWSDSELAVDVDPAEHQCVDDRILWLYGPGSVRLSCERSFSLRSVSPESDCRV